MFSKFFVRVVFGSVLLVPALAHMNMMSPPPLRHRDNPNTQNPMPYYDFPLKSDGSDFPCKGYLSALDTPEGKPVAAWAAGSQQSFALEGSGTHYGGSCQLSLSYDRGKTFKVIKSYIGSCPHRINGGDQTFNFKVPSEAPSGEVLFSWSWNNREREFFQNCAVITITGGGTGISDLPDMLVSNIGNGCTSPLTNAELQYPNPGPVIETGDKEYPLELPSGNCGAAGPASPSPNPSTTGKSSTPPKATPDTQNTNILTTFYTKTITKYVTMTNVDPPKSTEPYR